MELSNIDETLLVASDGTVKPYSLYLQNMLFEDLREWRLNEAAIIELPAYCILDDKTLYNIVNVLPKTECDLWLIPGVASIKIKEYGKDILDIVKAFMFANDVANVLYGKEAIQINHKNEALLGYLGLLSYFGRK